MERVALAPRPNWVAEVEELGFDFHTIDGAVYWDESAYWRFSSEEIDRLEDCADALHLLCLQAVERVAQDRDELARFGIVDAAADLVQHSWAMREPYIYGRFDIAWDGTGEPKMLEYNADTPTSLFEASVVQWSWLQQRFPESDQFNSIHEALHDRFSSLAQRLRPDRSGRKTLHLTCQVPHGEDEGTVRYLEAVAVEAGFAAKFLPLDHIGWDGKRFIDMEGETIERLFKLYPWEWLIRDEFSSHIDQQKMGVLEPAWKMVLSNKAILAVLWEMFPDCPYLLPVSFDRADIAGPAVRKPLLGREGANVALLGETDEAETPGPYTDSGFIYQARASLADAGPGGHAVLGLWMVEDKACGLGVREDKSLITTDSSRFVPHLFV
jgi:glutathionylspermidine synthase